MSDAPDKKQLFATVAMAEILLAQNMVAETRQVVAELLDVEPSNPRIRALADRLSEVEQGESPKPCPLPETGTDHIGLSVADRAMDVRFEITEKGVAIAKRVARYSGRPIVRIFTAAPGPRGVRTVTRDIDVHVGAAALRLFGMQRPAVHVAAVGYLANTGLFIAMAETEASLVLS